MTEKDKAVYEAKAAKDKERYEAEKRAYNVTNTLLFQFIPSYTLMHIPGLNSRAVYKLGISSRSKTSCSLFYCDYFGFAAFPSLFPDGVGREGRKLSWLVACWVLALLYLRFEFVSELFIRFFLCFPLSL
jgi:hypothetical protein